MEHNNTFFIIHRMCLGWPRCICSRPTQTHHFLPIQDTVMQFTRKITTFLCTDTRAIAPQTISQGRDETKYVYSLRGGGGSVATQIYLYFCCVAKEFVLFSSFGFQSIRNLEHNFTNWCGNPIHQKYLSFHKTTRRRPHLPDDRTTPPRATCAHPL